METKKSAPSLYAFKFLLFALLFMALIIAVCGLWGRFGAAGTAATADSPDDEKKPIIIIDAGHGGADGGAPGIIEGVSEKNLNLDISLTIADMLRAAGCEVVLTRDTDVMLTLPDGGATKKVQDIKARLNISNEYSNAVLVSIHMNSFPVEKYSGLQVWYSPNDLRSKDLAEIIQNKVKSTLQPDNSRAVKKSDENIYLMYNASCPAVLVECGFISNTAECAKLNDPMYRQELSSVLSVAILDYISEKH